MALILPGPLAAAVSGKAGDLVFARNQGGQYSRTIGTWDQSEPTEAQQAARDALATITARWSAVMSAAQRASWQTYAATHRYPDRFGRPHNISGFASYVKHNFHLVRSNPAYSIYTAPTLPPAPQPTTTITASAAADTVTIALPPSTYPNTGPDMYLWLYAGKPVAAGVSFFNGPWQWLGKNWRISGVWQAVATYDYPWPITPGDRIHVKIIAQPWTWEISSPYMARYQT